jgi:hypothetical protein
MTEAIRGRAGVDVWRDWRRREWLASVEQEVRRMMRIRVACWTPSGRGRGRGVGPRWAYGEIVRGEKQR